jgi:hypothetical protein
MRIYKDLEVTAIVKCRLQELIQQGSVIEYII